MESAGARARVLRAGLSCLLASPARAEEPSADPRRDFATGDLSGYARADLSLAYRFPWRLAPLALTTAVRNLFNHDYAESIGFPAPLTWFLIGFRYEL
jgi:outer membrane receptor protein involved in Fe transport